MVCNLDPLISSFNKRDVLQFFCSNEFLMCAASFLNQMCSEVNYCSMSIPLGVQSLSAALVFATVPLLPYVLSPLLHHPFFFHDVCPALSVTLSCHLSCASRRSQMGNSAPSALLISVHGRTFPPRKHIPPLLPHPPLSNSVSFPFSVPLTPALSISPFCCFLIPHYIPVFGVTPDLSPPMELLEVAP